MNKKVLLIIAPVFSPKMPPTGVGYLESFLKKNGISAEILDINNIFYNLSGTDLKKIWANSCNKSLEENILSIIRGSFPEKFEEIFKQILCYDILGFSCFKSNFSTTLSIIKLIRSKKPSMKIVLGGPEILRLYYKTKLKFTEDIFGLADQIVLGEGELPLLDYILHGKNKLDSFNELSDLENIPFPKYSSLDMKNYSKKAIPILFGRGCIRSCFFCSERLLYKKFRLRKIQSVIDEIFFHRSTNNINSFIFNDSMINANLVQLEKLCDEIIRNYGSVPWEAQMYIRNDMESRLFEKMKLSGCYNLFIGLESGSDNTLKKMNKGFSTEEAVSFFKKLNEHSLAFGVSIIIGFPGETQNDFEESLDFLLKNKPLIPKIEQVNPFTYYDGTPLDKKYDYSVNKTSLERYEAFISKVKIHGFKYTNSFLGNLIEKNDQY